MTDVFTSSMPSESPTDPDSDSPPADPVSEEPPSDRRFSSGPTRPAVALPAGTVLRDEYRVEEVLGTGSFGVTYRAVDRHLQAAVAIKEYFPRQLATRAGSTLTLRARSSDASSGFEEGLQRFMEEGRTIARFDHPNVVDVRSYFEENGTGYLVMNYYEGASLDGYLSRKGGTLSEEEALSLMEDVLSGLSAIHEEGVLHRDVGPKNIYRKEDGEAILIDFGAAREATQAQSQELSTVLTPGYAPIEQYGGGGQGPWTDVYACAATLYKCLTGEKPPEATSRVQGDDLPPAGEICPGASREVALAVRKGLALYPERRPQSAEAFGAVLRGEPIEETGGQTVEATRRGTQIAEETDLEQGEVPASREVAEKALSEEALPEEAPEGSPAETEATLSPEESGRSFWRRSLGPLALGLAIAASIGGALLFGEAGPLQVFAYVGTWIATAGGTVLLFREGEKAMSPEARAAVSDWLLKEDFAERPSNWPETFISLFDAVFTEDHLSWTCFWRSVTATLSILSIVYICIIWSGLIPVYWIDNSFFEFASRSSVVPIRVDIFSTAFSFILAMVITDYVSLYETRIVLGTMKSSNPTYIPALIFFDFFASLFIYISLFDPYSGIFKDLISFTYSVLTDYLFSEGILWVFKLYSLEIISMVSIPIGSILEYLSSPYELFLLFVPEGGGDTLITTAMVYTTYFTSVWVWLYAGAGALLQLVRPFLASVDWLKRRLDVETHPVHTIGLLLAVLMTVGFALGAPFAL